MTIVLHLVYVEAPLKKRSRVLNNGLQWYRNQVSTSIPVTWCTKHGQKIKIQESILLWLLFSFLFLSFLTLAFSPNNYEFVIFTQTSVPLPGTTSPLLYLLNMEINKKKKLALLAYGSVRFCFRYNIFFTIIIIFFLKF